LFTGTRDARYEEQTTDKTQYHVLQF